ncbi:Copper amine oxidase-like protein [Phytophthora palmivora]|uniref:Copper amine oxidase-like protein n=1 Tax=Phytophthora palmivora TaxID=4796 RepID=A0A2P4YFX0_9STRA|nr:Copper amine oxidase-like protein [Phytophthora palmivora]
MTWMTNAWENLSVDTLASGFRKLAIPTDTRAIPLENSRLQAKEVDVLVQKLERFAITEEVENDFGLREVSTHLLALLPQELAAVKIFTEFLLSVGLSSESIDKMH